MRLLQGKLETRDKTRAELEKEFARKQEMLEAALYAVLLYSTYIEGGAPCGAHVCTTAVLYACFTAVLYLYRGGGSIEGVTIGSTRI